jgi:hypothetical protein
MLRNSNLQRQLLPRLVILRFTLRTRTLLSRLSLNTTRTRPMRRIHRLCNTRISHIPLRLGIRMRTRLHHLKDTSYLRLSSLPHLLRNLCLRRALE